MGHLVQKNMLINTDDLCCIIEDSRSIFILPPDDMFHCSLGNFYQIISNDDMKVFWIPMQKSSNLSSVYFCKTQSVCMFGELFELNVFLVIFLVISSLRSQGDNKVVPWSLGTSPSSPSFYNIWLPSTTHHYNKYFLCKLCLFFIVLCIK